MSFPTRRPTLRRLLHGNVGALALISLLNDAASEMIYPLLPLFLVGTLGAGPAFLGLVEGVAESASSLVKLAGGWLSDRLRRRKLLVGWGYAVAGAARPLMALAAAPWHVLTIRFSDRVGKGVRTAPRDALLADSVEAERRGLAFGVHRAADHAGALAGPLIAALLLLVFPGRLRLVFALSALPAAAALLVLAWRVRELGPAAARGPGTLETEKGRLRALGPAAAREPGTLETEEGGRLRDLGSDFFRYLAILLLFTLGNASDAFLLLRAGELGVSAAALPLLWGAFHVSKMTWSVPGGVLADRLGPGRVIVIGWLVYAITYAGFAFAGGPAAAWGLFLVYGLFFGLTESPEKALVSSLAPAVLRARAYGAFHAAVGIAALPASLIFGVVWQAFGPPVAFLMGAGVAGASAGLLALALPGLRRGAADFTAPSPETLQR
ncbi:MAG: MFS transporter [Gemmatimonadota bacterium]